MEAKEKAQELIEKFKKYSWASSIEGYEEFSRKESAIKCALIAVDEILQLNIESILMDDGSWMKSEIFWIEVKSELENL